MPRCLIVDDHDDGRDGFREYLESFEFEVTGTATAEQALGVMTLAPYDLLIVDLLLPGMDGCEYIRRVRRGARRRDVPIIALSACAFPEDRARAEAAGCDAFLTKPCPPEELLSTMRRLLSEGVTRRSA
jgi:two-component system cell cycle response regulator DivK